MNPITISNSIDHLIACSDCDTLLNRAEVPAGHSLICPRCGKTISRRNRDSILKTLALSIAGLLLYLPAILLPLMTMKSFGFSDSANILESVVNFYCNDYYFVSFMVLISAVVFPLLLLTSIFVISLQLSRQQYPSYLPRLFRTYLHLEEWAMVEVYLLGILITIIKMGTSAEIFYHTGIFCFTGLVLLTLTITSIIDKEDFWQAIDQKGEKKPGEPAVRRRPDHGGPVTAAGHGLILCHICHKLSPTALEGERCPRCKEMLHTRKPFSISRTWALLLTSAIFLAPANLLPIMRVDFMGVPDRSTIIDGIIYFFRHDAYVIGLIIFTASVLVPVFKIVGIAILLLSNRPCDVYLLRQKARMFRFISFIGRWSMLDIFVIALLTVLVDFGFFTSIHIAPAATYFCIVVASTMFAVITFDPRIIWDKCSISETVITDRITRNASRPRQ
ncbi:paraquat-inducible protein A [Desulfocastanea catecholica]